METLMQILSYLFPTGLGTLIGWIFSRNVYQAKSRKQVHDIYQQMYDDVCDTLKNVQNENRKLYRAISRLERAIGKATTCRHFADCPMRGELQEQATDDTNDIRPLRQSAKHKKNRRMARDGPAEPGEAEPSDGQRG